MHSTFTLPGPDGRLRCRWCLATPEYLRYHDSEWGFPVTDDRRLFEKLCLEGFQSGLSWRTILEKRKNFRQAFHDFDHLKVAAFTDADVERLLQNAGIIRHRGKIEAVVNNARRMIELVEEEGSLSDFVWRYAPAVRRSSRWTSRSRADDRAPGHADEPVVIAHSPESAALSKELKKRGWKFVGPTTVYSFMQAMGLVNDHFPQCALWEGVERAREEFFRPASASR